LLRRAAHEIFALKEQKTPDNWSCDGSLRRGRRRGVLEGNPWRNQLRPPRPCRDFQLGIQGDLAHLRGDHDRAIGNYGAAFLLDPGNRTVVEEYGNVQLKGNYQLLLNHGKAWSWQPDEVHRFLRIMFHRDDENAVLRTGRQYQRAGWHEAARAQYRQVLAMNPQHAEAAASLQLLGR
jgi:tetratricopeptide (TPR) repeat protein